SDLLDGGGTVAADSAGNVYMAWHGVSKVARGEVSREVWLAHSTDEGKTFGQEIVANHPRSACACRCGQAWSLNWLSKPVVRNRASGSGCVLAGHSRLRHAGRQRR